MEKIKQYYMLSAIKPKNKTLYLPLYSSNFLKIRFDFKEIYLHYKNELGIWMPQKTQKFIEIE